VGVFGVRGEVRLHLHHRESTLLKRPREVVLESKDGARQVVRLSARSGAGKRVIGSVDGVTDPERARELIGWTVRIDRSALPAPAPGEFYVWAVPGLAVWMGGDQVGTAVDVHETPGGDVLEVELPDGPVFVPLLREWVVEVNVQGGRVVLAPGAIEVD
jgi:16S rRNA processing protein RimM